MEADLIQLTEEARGGWGIVSARGRADAEGADQLETALRAAVDNHFRVAADFAKLDYISSAGLRAVLQAARAAQEKRVEFVVCRLSAPAQKVFDMSGMRHILQILEDLPC